MSTEQQARKVAQDQANSTGTPWMIYRDAASGEFDAGSEEVVSNHLNNGNEPADLIETIHPDEERRTLSAMAQSVVMNAKGDPGTVYGIARNGRNAEITYNADTDLCYITGYDKGLYYSEAVAMLEYILTRPAPSGQDGGADHIPTPAEIYAILNKAYADLAEARESVYFEEQRLNRRKQELEEQETNLRKSGALDLGEKATDTQRKARLFDLTTAERALLESTRDGFEEACHKLKQAEAEKERARAILRVLELAAGINRDNHQ